MSGSSGGNSSFSKNRHSDNSNGLGNGQEGQGDNNHCHLIKEITYVNSPKNGVKELNIGDILTLKVESSNGIRVIKVYDKNGTLIGGISSIESDAIIDCIENGYVYIAEVLEINQAKIKVKITCQIQDET